MRSWEITPSQLQYDVDLNSVVTSEGIVRMPPRLLQHRWARLLDETSETSVAPNLEHLMKFLAAEARIARSWFGQMVLSTTAKPLALPHNSAYRNDRSVNFARSNSKGKREQFCIVCK
ncbi:hypothetical protein FGIG_10995 [Fasciola gigantica]|uniref:Uncharacterized protein n=1 Tax=Fasciola gigantica TaxID=46835 RepID=A0A504YVI3_FASGI|nr:hypothetical protein FGIG_10995 [Fasciola gigantica]